MKQLVVSISEELFNKMVDVSKLPEHELARDFTKAFVKSIVNGKPRDSVLDEIRAEIEQEYTKFRNKSDMWSERACGLGTALEIIDKYKEDDTE